MTPPAIASEQDAGERHLQNYRRELDEQGYTVVPPEVTGVDGSMVDALTERLLEKCELLIGCKFTVEHGPERELDYGEFRGFLERISNATPSQFQLMQLCTYHRVFRDLAVNPVATSLIDHLFGTTGSHRVARFSSHNCFVKWAGDGYGESLGLHADQAGIPRPWGDKALNANCNWCLTDYTLRDGAFACVPGSHRKKSLPNLPDCVQDAIPHRMPARFGYRVSRCALARRVPKNDARPAPHARVFLPPHGDTAAGRHSRSIPERTRARLRGPGPLHPTRRFRQPVPVAGVSAAAGHPRRTGGSRRITDGRLKAWFGNRKSTKSRDGGRSPKPWAARPASPSNDGAASSRCASAFTCWRIPARSGKSDSSPAPPLTKATSSSTCGPPT